MRFERFCFGYRTAGHHPAGSQLLASTTGWYAQHSRQSELGRCKGETHLRSREENAAHNRRLDSRIPTIAPAYFGHLSLHGFARGISSKRKYGWRGAIWCAVRGSPFGPTDMAPHIDHPTPGIVLLTTTPCVLPAVADTHQAQLQLTPGRQRQADGPSSSLPWPLR